MQTKNYFFQWIRAIAVFAVICIHISIDESSPGNLTIGMFFKSFVLFPVPLFFFMSGYFYNPNGNFWKRIQRLLIPYLLWSLIYLALKGNFDVLSISKALLLATGAVHLYFLFVLLQITVLLHVLKKSQWSKTILLLLTPFHILALYVFRLNGVEVLHGINYHLFTAWIIFYILGIMLRNGQLKIKLNAPVLMALSILCLLLSVSETFGLYAYTGKLVWSATQLKFSSMFYAFFIILLIVKLNDAVKIRDSFITRIGDYSMGIYLLHMMVMIALEKLVNILGLQCPNSYLLIPYNLLYGLVVLVISYYCVKVATRILGKKIARIIGLY